MKRIALAALSALLLAACGNFAGRHLETADAPVLTPEYGRTVRETVPNHAENKRFAPPPGTPDGAASFGDSKGRTLKSFVRNGKFVGNVNIYYPNGRLHSETPMKNGLPDGWSAGYEADGTLKSKILYRNGTVIKMQSFDENGRLLREIRAQQTESD